MKFYLCAGTSIWEEVELARKQLEERGHEVVSRWHQREESPRLEITDPAIADRARECLDDIDDADALIAWSMADRGTNRGGRHAEFGYGLREGCTLFLIGQPEHAFHTCVDERFDGFDQFLAYLDAQEEVDLK